MRATPRRLVPRELQEEGEGEVVVGLVDQRGEEYDPERHGREDDDRGSRDIFQSFSGEQKSLGGGVTSTSSLAGGIIDPIHLDNALLPPPVDTSRPMTFIVIRLPNGKRIMVKLNSLHSIAMLGQHIAGALEGQYVMTLGYPPRTIENLEFGGEHGKGRVDVGTGGGGESRLSYERCKYYLDGYENCYYLICVLIVSQFGAVVAVKFVQYHTISQC